MKKRKSRYKFYENLVIIQNKLQIQEKMQLIETKL